MGLNAEVVIGRTPGMKLVHSKWMFLGLVQHQYLRQLYCLSGFDRSRLFAIDEQHRGAGLFALGGRAQNRHRESAVGMHIIWRR